MVTLDDLFTVAFLFQNGFKPKITYDPGDRRVYFHYPEFIELDQAIQEFDQNASIGVLDFKTAWRVMRNEMMSVKDRKDLLTRRSINNGTTRSNQPKI